MRRLRRDETGQALVLALAIVVIGMILGLGAIAYALNVSGAAGHDERTRGAQQASEGGLQTQLLDLSSANATGYKLNQSSNGFATMTNLLACAVPDISGTQVVGTLPLGVSSGPCPSQVASTCATNAMTCTNLTAAWSPESNGSWSESETFPSPQLQGSSSGSYPVLFPDVVSLGCKTNDTTNGASTCNAPNSAAATAGRNSYAREMAILDPTAPLQAVEGENDVMIYSPGLLGQTAPTEVIDGNIVAGNNLSLPAYSAPVTTAGSFGSLVFGGGNATNSPSTLIGGGTSGSNGQIKPLSGLQPVLDYGYHCGATAFMGLTTPDACATDTGVSGGTVSLDQTGNASGPNPCTAGSPSTNCWLQRPAFKLSALSAAGAVACPPPTPNPYSGGTGGCSNGFLDYTGTVTLTAPGTYVFCGVDIGGQLRSSGSGPIQIFVAGPGQDGCTSNGFAVAAYALVDGTNSPNLIGSPGLKIDFSDYTSGGTTPYSYSWNFGDGSPTSTLQNPNHTYATAGTYTATETVTDASVPTALSENFAFTVIVTPPPLSVQTPSCTLSAVNGVVCSGTASGGTPGAGGYTYSWNFGDNGSRGDGSGSGTSGAVTSGAVSGSSTSGAITTGFDYAIPGTYLIRLTVTDSTGASQTATATLADTPLHVSTSTPATPGTVTVGQSTTFGAATLSAPSGGFGGYTYRWDLGDGGTGTVTSGVISGTATGTSVPGFSYRYASPGTYVATLLVTSADGQTVATAYVTNITVRASILSLANLLTLNPGIATASPATGPAALTTTFGYSQGLCIDGILSTGYTYSWSFGDGSTSTAQSPSHTYTAGIYPAQLTVTCSVVGLLPLSQAYVVTAVASDTLIPFSSTGTPPSASASGSTVAFTGQASEGPASTFTYSWKYGDGSTGTGETASHTYASAGTYTAVMTVSDNHSNMASYDLTVIVAAAPLTASATALPNPIRVGVNVGLTATVTGGTGPYASYTWNFGDGTPTSPDTQTSYNPSPQSAGGSVYGPVPHTYMSAGDYLATLTVKDAAGVVSSVAYVAVDVYPTAQSAYGTGNFIVSGGINQLASDNVTGLINGSTISSSSVDPAAFQVYMEGNPSDGLNPGTSTSDPSALGSFSTSSTYASVGGSSSFVDAFVIYAPRSSVNITAEAQGTTGGVFEGSAIGWNTSITALMILQDFNLGTYPLSSVVNANSDDQTVECDTSVIPLTNTSTDLNGCT